MGARFEKGIFSRPYMGTAVTFRRFEVFKKRAFLGGRSRLYYDYLSDARFTENTGFGRNKVAHIGGGRLFWKKGILPRGITPSPEKILRTKASPASGE